MMDDTLIVDRLDRALTKHLAKAMKSADVEAVRVGVDKFVDSILLSIDKMNIVVGDVNAEFTLVGDVINIKITIPNGFVECTEDECITYAVDSKKLPGLKGFCLSLSAKLEGNDVKIGLLHSTHQITNYTNIPFTSYIILNVNPKITFLNLPSYLKYRCKYYIKLLKGKINK